MKLAKYHIWYNYAIMIEADNSRAQKIREGHSKRGRRISNFGSDTMLEEIPTQSEMIELIGQSLFEVRQNVCRVIW